MLFSMTLAIIYDLEIKVVGVGVMLCKTYINQGQSNATIVILHIQSNFNGSNTYGTIKVSSRQR